jgi:hypothetical protein
MGKLLGLAAAIAAGAVVEGQDSAPFSEIMNNRANLRPWMYRQKFRLSEAKFDAAKPACLGRDMPVDP